MSYCELLGFHSNGLECIETYQNAHGWTAFVWKKLYDKYIPKEFEWDVWLDNPDKLWALYDDPRLTPVERSVFASTFDRFLVRIEDAEKYADALEVFRQLHPAGDRVCHLAEIICRVREIAANPGEFVALGWYGMSVGENPWVTYNVDEDKDEPYLVGTSDKHEFVSFFSF